MKIDVSTRPTEKAEIPVRRSDSGIPKLTRANRCDACPGGSSAAYAAALLPGATYPLYFCGHHFTVYEVKLREISIEIVDERDRLRREVKEQKSRA